MVSDCPADMCWLLLSSGPIGDRAKRLPTSHISVEAGAKLVLPSDERPLNQPYATIFTVSIETEGMDEWQGVFAFDLIRKDTRWSPLQDAARMLGKYFGMGDRGDGWNRWMWALAGGLIGPEAQEALSAPCAALSSGKLDGVTRLFEASREVEHAPAFSSIRSRFSETSLAHILEHAASEFQIYTTVTSAHSRDAWRDPFVVRIVSAPDSKHRLLFEVQPRTTGMGTPLDEDLAQWFTRRFLADGGPHFESWKRAVWAGLVGKQESDLLIDHWASPSQCAQLRVILGSTNVTGLAADYVTVAYDSIREIRAMNERVIFQATSYNLGGTAVPVVLGLVCKDAASARELVQGLSLRYHRRLGRGRTIRSAFAVYLGKFRQGCFTGDFSLEEMKAIFTRYAQSDLEDVDQKPANTWITGRRSE